MMVGKSSGASSAGVSIEVPSYNKGTEQLTAWYKPHGFVPKRVAIFRNETLIILDSLIASVFSSFIEGEQFVFTRFEPFEGERTISFSDPRAPRAFMQVNSAIKEGFQSGMYLWEVEPLNSERASK